ncbi:hypothetical protein [Cobetia sp. 1CM21F]|uniref:hypothetical protein n=1 Tax=Cobetia sp. 1CM21F TaxID=2929163 RepID=UPI0020C101FD|nr:hypothetical protein [Cobetia sp. 1CM21F]MCK8066922.1 hypothetical protein [Cobetia sp. 1CM21F]
MIKREYLISCFFLIYLFCVCTQLDIYNGDIAVNSLKSKQAILGVILSIGAVFACKNLKKLKFDKSSFFIFFAFNLYFLLHLFVFEQNLTVLKNIIITDLMILSALMFYTVLKNDIFIFKKVLHVFLIFNALMLLLQFCLYYVFKVYIDVHSFFFPFSRSLDETLSWGIFRPRGMQLEPGVYSIVMITGVIISYALSNKVKILHVFLLGTVFLTTSISGILTATLLIIYLSFNTNNYRSVISVLLFLSFTIALLLNLGLYEYLDTRYFSRVVFDEDSSDGSKLQALTFLVNADFPRIFWGSGYSVNDTDVDVYIRSLGPLFSSIFFAGIFGAIFYLYLLSKIKRKLVFLLLILSVLKVGLDFPLYWMAIFLLQTRRHNNNHKKEYRV